MYMYVFNLHYTTAYAYGGGGWGTYRMLVDVLRTGVFAASSSAASNSGAGVIANKSSGNAEHYRVNKSQR